MAPTLGHPGQGTLLTLDVDRTPAAYHQHGPEALEKDFASPLL